MTWRELMYQLNDWDKERPELLDQPAIVRIDSEYIDEDALINEGMELDGLELQPVDDFVTDDRITQPDQLIITP